MRNLMLVLWREYIVRVRTRAFLVFTVLMPLFLAAVVLLPGKLAVEEISPRRVGVVAADPLLGGEVRVELAQAHLAGRDGMAQAPDGESPAMPQFEVTLEGAPSEAVRQRITEALRTRQLDGVVWIDTDAVATRKLTYYSRNAGDFVTSAMAGRALRIALGQRQLVSHGFSARQAKALLSPVFVDTVRVDNHGTKPSNGLGALLLPFVLLFAIYLTVLIYGVYVMRSVIEEKSSRVVEVLLGSVSPMQLMAGKIIGVGAVGLTQIVLWAGSAALLSHGSNAMARHVLGESIRDAHLPAAVLVLFPVFFILGYATYACLYAAIGAMVNSDEEASQYQFPVTLPLLLCMVFATSIIGDPNTPLAFWLSMFPLTSPIIMFVRVSVSMPPAWQIALSITLSVLSLYGLVWVSARIFRVGILMYGKRPSLRELVKWLHYA
jgi:ABC-2 type transport system permease protein